MKLLGSFLWSKRRTLAAFLLFAAIFGTVFALYHLPLAAVVYPAALCAAVGLVLLLLEYHRVQRTHRTLRQLAAQTQVALSGLPRPDGPLEADYQALLAQSQQALEGLRAADAADYQEMMDYYTVWAHQIKTPIAAMKLTLQNEDSPVSRQLRGDLLRIEQYVQMVLTYLRLDNGGSDFVFRECALDDVIRPAVRKFAPEFIGRRLRLNYEPLQTRVITDEKWLGFVVEQVLSNALKYTRQGGVSITLEAPKTLCIADTGIGIAPADLPRVFEKGYTGYNGREDRAASGIGLYLCRRVCDELGAAITVSSRVGEGTQVRIDLSQYRLRPE